MNELASPIATVMVGLVAAYVSRLNARDPFSRLRAALELRDNMPEECLVVWDEYVRRQVVRASLDRSDTRTGLVLAAIGLPLILTGPLTEPWGPWLSAVGWVLYVVGLIYWALALHLLERQRTSSQETIRDRPSDETSTGAGAGKGGPELAHRSRP